MGNAPADDIDRAADGLTAEEQHCGAAQNLDPFRRERIDGHTMVGRGVGNVQRTQSIGQYADAFTLEAAQNRARCAGRERGGRHAWLAGQRVTDLSARLAHQFLAGDGGQAGNDIDLVDEVCGHHDLVVHFGIDSRALGAGSLCPGQTGDHAGSQQ